MVGWVVSMAPGILHEQLGALACTRCDDFLLLDHDGERADEHRARFLQRHKRCREKKP